ncbi:isopenicillin N synthase family oxygenase [Mangrovicoccus sp. HB161399]|uniref:isopenicillin N synthase family dioxygenase n=1 Tax=Mangrovicoccus sp. HB161399 TaxID=2720392 RepID=UPI001556FE0B|nr:isopenicillin N synthase family oxygenase [Mangrovicoccus sp. HB161399]
MAQTALPVIDVSGLASPDAATRKAVAGEIGRACVEHGFFYVSGHGIPEEVIQGGVGAARRFFAQPLEKRLEIRAGATNRGYTPLRESEHEEGKPDVNEGFELGFPVPPEDPDFDGSNPVRAPNRWPDLDGFREPVEAHYFAVFDLGMRLLRGFALHFGLPEDYFSGTFTRPVADMRLAHYPPQDGEGVEFGTFDHTDHGVITILWQDNNGGLEVQAASGSWMPAPPVPGTFVVNIGDLLSHWTNGRFRSTLHRVINRPGVDRHSIPFFFNPDFDTDVNPAEIPGIADGTPVLPPVVSGPYLIGRFSDYRHSWKEDAV